MKLPIKQGFLLCGCCLLAGCDGDRQRKAEVPVLQPAPAVTSPPPFAPPLRRCADVLTSASPAEREPQRTDDVMVRSSQVDDDIQLAVHAGSGESLNNSPWLTEKLGFAPTAGTSGLLRRRVSARDKAAVARELTALIALTADDVRQAQQRLAAAGEPGLLPGKVSGAGRLVYTGHPLDIAMPDAGRGTSFFLPVLTPNGNRAYTRGGRLFVDDEGRLALREGLLTVPVTVPPEAQSLRVQPTGEIEAVLTQGGMKVLGRLCLVALEDPEGDGRIFSGSPGSTILAGESSVPVLKPGHLEYPRVNMRTELARMADRERNLRLLQRIELGLAEPFRQTMVNLPVQPVQPVESSQDRSIGFPLVIGADLVLATSHLKALGIQVEANPGRTVIPTGDREEARTQVINALTKVLQGLRKRMDIAQLNYRNANQMRDEQGQLNPYRRKLIRVGPEGVLLEAEDETPFRKEFNPNHPDVGPDGSVLFPNVNRLVEKADFEQATTEYRLIRTALERLAPGVIFPDPPALQVEAKAP